MERKPTAIITGDIHLREDQPICRTDDFQAAMKRKIAWLRDLQREYNIPILDSGDLFHHWKPSPALLKWAIENLPDSITTIPGNHDLPAHSLDLYDKSGLAVLEAAGKVKVGKVPDVDQRMVGMAEVDYYPWGMPPRENWRQSLKAVALIHTMTYLGESPFPGCKDPDALSLLKSMVGYDLVITGHNHEFFIVEGDGEDFFSNIPPGSTISGRERRLLVNPGSLLRSTASQADHKPRVYLWYAEDNTVEPVFVPIDSDVVSRNHIEVQEYRDARAEAFVNSLSGNFEVGLSYERNMETFIATESIPAPIQKHVWSAIKGEA